MNAEMFNAYILERNNKLTIEKISIQMLQRIFQDHIIDAFNLAIFLVLQRID